LNEEQTPLWRWLVVGLLCVCVAAYFIATGEIAVDKKGTLFVSRAASPLAYWLIVSVVTAMGAAAFYQTSKRLFSQ